MKRLVLLSVTVVAFMTGCGTFGPTGEQTKAMKEGYKAWVEQPRYISPVEADGTNMTVTVSVTGAHHFALNSAVDPLPMLPRDPTMWEEAGETVRATLPIAAGAYLLKGNVGNGSTVNNYTTKP